jgi:hypothetical protein
MASKDEHKIRRRFEQFERKLPRVIAGVIRALRKSRWLRIPAGILFVIGGIFGALPVLGFWMLPVGLMFLALDLPFLQRPVRQALTWGERRWTRWKQARRRRQ